MKWFSMNEFECHCGCRMPDSARANIVALVEQVLDPARERYGKPVCVNSGYRCARHNAAVGGVANSRHTRGEAADVVPGESGQVTGDSLERLARIIEENGRYDQLIRYMGPGGKIRFIHVSWKSNGQNRKMKFDK